MRTLTIGALGTLDGVQHDPRSWTAPWFDDAAAESLAKLLEADAMLMGCRTYEYFAAARPRASGAYADRVKRPTGVVSSRYTGDDRVPPVPHATAVGL